MTTLSAIGIETYNQISLIAAAGVHQTVREIADTIDAGCDRDDEAYELLLDAQRELCRIHKARL